MSDHSPLQFPLLGRYRHFKGGEYEVVAIAEDADLGVPMVVYRNVVRGGWYVRSVRSWNAKVPGRSRDAVQRFTRMDTT